MDRTFQNNTAYNNTSLSKSKYEGQFNTLEVKDKNMSKDRLRDFHSERVMFLGDKKGYMNTYKAFVSNYQSKYYF